MTRSVPTILLLLLAHHLIYPTHTRSYSPPPRSQPKPLSVTLPLSVIEQRRRQRLYPPSSYPMPRAGTKTGASKDSAEASHAELGSGGTPPKRGSGGGWNKLTCLAFEEARAIVRTHKLANKIEWATWCKDSGQRPSNIPTNPHIKYRDDGWISYPDWMGYTRFSPKVDSMLPFAAAKAIVHTLKLGSFEEWIEWANKSGKRPPNIPSNPSTYYRGNGWLYYSDWMGYKGRAVGRMLPFVAARAIVWKLKLKSVKEWEAWRKAGHRPSNIPADPARVYRDDGFISYSDWMGYKANRARGQMLPFAQARDYVRKFKLGSKKEWRAWSNSASGKRPSNNPSKPQEVYRDVGWISMPDWLGYAKFEAPAKDSPRLPLSAGKEEEKTRAHLLRLTRRTKSALEPFRAPICPTF